MANTSPGFVSNNTMLGGKLCYLFILAQIQLAGVLDVVIDCEDRLTLSENLRDRICCSKGSSLFTDMIT